MDRARGPFSASAVRRRRLIPAVVPSASETLYGRRMSVRIAWTDAAAGAVLAGYGAFEVLSGIAPGVGAVPGDPVASTTAAVVAGLATALLRRAPLVGLAAVVLAVGAESALTVPAEGLAPLVSGLLLVFSAAARCTRRVALVALVGAVVGIGAAVGDVVFVGVVHAVPWLAGRVAGDRRRLLAALQVASVEDASRAVQAERDRIARELHDIVSHALSLVVVQAQVAQAHVRTRPEEAERSLAAVKEAGQQALAEMRRLLGVLRDDEGGTSTLGPQPGLDELPVLLERVRAAGLEVELRESGDRRPLAPGASLTAYRVVQEALTNVLRHAGPTRVQLTLEWTPASISVAVRDHGLAAATPVGSGRGLLGLRERVALYGGTLRAGAARGGGFEVEAVLPA